MTQPSSIDTEVSTAVNLSKPDFKLLSITLPVYNERDNVSLIYDAIRKAVATLGIDYEIIFVDDGSKDGTRQILKEMAKSDPRIKLVFFKRNFGQTAAMSAGFKYAAGDVIISMDADLQNDPADIPHLLNKLSEGFDVVCGWRKNRKDKTLSRKIPSWIANRIISWAGGVRLHDYGCSLKAYRSEFVKDIRLYGEMHRFIPIYAKWQGAQITEMVVTHHARKFGKSKYGINRTLKVIFDLLLIKFLEKYFQKPIYIFGNFCFYNMIGAFISFSLMLYFKLSGQKDFVQTPLPTLAVTFFLVGILSLMIGLVAEVNNRIYYESQNKLPYDVKETINL